MEIKLSNQEAESYFYNALCNAVGSGYFDGYGVRVDYLKEDYQAARTKLEAPSYEDVLMQILRDGKALTFTDVEGEGDMTKNITLADVHNNVSKTPVGHLLDMVNEEDDAVTADIILQTVVYGEIIFG